MVLSMTGLDKNDLAQMNEDYFKSLNNERLVEEARESTSISYGVMGETTTPIQKIALCLHRRIILTLQTLQKKSQARTLRRN